MTAASPSGDPDRPKSGAMRPSTSRRLAFPPAPCAISICASRKRTASARANNGSTVDMVVIRGTRPFRRHHQCADWPFGGAFPAEQLALLRFQHPLEHLAALCGHRVRDRHTRDGEPPLGIPLSILVADFQCRLREKPQAPPLKIWPQFADIADRLQ